MAKILIVEDDTSFAQMLSKFLDKKGYEVTHSPTGLDGEKKIKESIFDLIITDLRLPDYDGIKLISQSNHKVPIIVMTSYAEVPTAVLAMKEGAYDYISKPFAPDQILDIIESALNKKEDITEKKDKVRNNGPSTLSIEGNEVLEKEELKFISEASDKLKQYISLVAPTNMSVLITGESGTGKEVTAKSIHNNSKRKGKAFMALDCGAIPKELATSEFFGHLKGSFTGAISDKIGSFEAANGGTLFLDEVGNLSYENQVQLLRALQERKIKRIGSNAEIKVDVRIISATNEDLKLAVERGSFREDLYHRLNEFSLKIPSLVDRPEDLPIFADHFLKVSNEKLGKQVDGFSNEVWDIFKSYSWPGNIRQLQNVVQRAVLLSENGDIQPSALPPDILEPSQKTSSVNMTKEEFEKDRIIKALKRTNYNKSKAAKLLQITRKTLYNRIGYYKLDV